METKNDEERIVVNGGCFPLHWVRKFFNIATSDIEDKAVTEAKLEDALVSKIGQAIAGMQLTWNATSGCVTVTNTKGESVKLTLAPATTAMAGVMSAEDKGKVENAVRDVTLTTDDTSVSLKMTKSGQAASTVEKIPTVTETTAGVMSATMLTALKAAYSIVGSTMDESSVSLQLTKNSGDITNTTVKAATTSYAGVMSAEDKRNLDDAVKQIESLKARVTALEKGDTGTCGCSDISDDTVDDILYSGK